MDQEREIKEEESDKSQELNTISTASEHQEETKDEVTFTRMRKKTV